MNKYDSTHDGWQSGTEHVQAASRPARLIQRLLQLSLADVMHVCLLFLLVIATAQAVFLGDGPMHSADASEAAPLTIEQITLEAKARLAEGAPADEVAAWVDQATVSAGIVGTAPMLDASMETHAALAWRSASLDPAESPHRDRCGHAKACTHRD